MNMPYLKFTHAHDIVVMGECGQRLGALLRRHGRIVALQNNRMFTERIPL